MTTDVPYPSLTDTHIVFVNNFSGPGIGGGEVQLLYMLDGAVDAGMDVHLIAPPKSGIAAAGREHGALVTEIDLRASALPTSFQHLRRTLAELEPQIVQGTGFLTNQLSRAAAPAAAKVISTVHVEPGASIHDGGSKIGLAVRDIAERATRKRADVQVAVSQAVANKLVADGSDPERVCVIHNGVDPEALVREADTQPTPDRFPTALRASDARGAAGPDAHAASDDAAGSTIFGVLARLEPVKGVAEFVRAAGIMSSLAGPNYTFVLSGTGSQAAEIDELRESLALHDQLTMLDYVPSAAAYLAACDIVVVPSLSEGFGIVAAEAMALGKPVIATRVGGLPEVVKDDVTGLLVEPGKPEALAAAMRDLAADAGRANAMGEAGKRRVAERFTSERMTSEYLSLYAELLDGA